MVNGVGPNSDWLRNIEAKPCAEVTAGSQHFIASHRFLDEEEAMRVIQVTSTETGSSPQLFAVGLAGCSDGNTVAAKVTASVWSGNCH